MASTPPGSPINNTATLNLPTTAKDSSKSGLTHALTIKLDEKNFLLWSQQKAFFPVCCIANMLMSRLDTPTIEDVEALLMLQEAQFEKFRQELTNPSVSINMAQKEAKLNNSGEDEDDEDVGTAHYNANAVRGRGRGKARSRGRGKAPQASNSNKSQRQIYGKLNHDAANCWHRYAPPNSRHSGRGYNAGFAYRPPHYNPYPRPSANLALPQYYHSIPETDTSSTASWCPDSRASHHLTFNPNNLAYRVPYQGQDQVILGNGQGVSIKSLGHSNFYSPYNPNVHLRLTDLLHVPSISKHLLSDSKQILLKGTVGSYGLYQFKPFAFTPGLNTNSNFQSSSESPLQQLEVPLPPHKKAIGCKWIFRVKENPDGSINKYKARLVAKGFLQTPGFDFTETFSPVIKPVTIRIILTLVVTYKWSVQQIDINNAFLNGVLQEEVYMTQPAGFEQSDKSLVCKLHKSLYGLKQAPRAWYEKLTQTLLQMGFTKSRCDPSLLVHHQHGACTYVLVYVDDILITGSDSHLIKDLIHKLNAKFALKQLGEVDYFLGIEVHHKQSGGLLLHQSKYIKDLLVKTKMENFKPIGSPMVSGYKLSKFGIDAMTDPTLYRSTVGALQYATLTRPDIAYSVNKGTLHHGLLLQPCLSSPPFSLRAYSDADWATDQDGRRSTSVSCIYFGSNLISWGSKKQQLVARSSTEAEYRSMANTTAELQVPCHTPTLLCDNLSAVSLTHNPILHSRTKHMELNIHFVRERVLSKHLNVLHVPAMDQLADPLTKPLAPSNYAAIRTKLKVFSCSENSCV
ncbi:hypothetical protein TSUD_378080 [Trifolium subterraneum]|uniref:Uncharacterized protein n=1 Tax=Trifolium subterraneum TaxID=3900 RepID=A0A2Z6NP41_TRISU|nr:hypothetical protein TSUD_378080 [Trifolium subterraneum]